MEEKMSKKYRTGAGILVYKRNGKTIELLALEGPDDHQVKHDGKWDLPKGIIDPGESILDCALRETFEEADYMVSKGDIIAGPYKHSECYMYIVEYDNIQQPRIKKNPLTGILEHKCCAWVPIDVVETEAYTWLRPFVSWAKKTINGT